MLLDSGAKYSLNYTNETPIKKVKPKKIAKKKKDSKRNKVVKRSRKEAF